MASKHRLYLVDGSGYIFRAYHALPPLTRKSDGMPIGAVSGFCNMLSSLRDKAEHDEAVSHMAVIFDAGRETFRSEIYPEYKANRSETPEDLIPQFAPIREATRAFGLPSIEKDGFEADDIIATYARIAHEAGMEVCVVSSDKDLMQLVRDGVGMMDPMKDRNIGPAEVMEKFGVAPDKVIDVQALAGDSTDNVPGVPGIGIKTAAELINIYGDLESLLARAGEIKQPKRRETLLNNADKARISYQLVKLKDDVPLELGLDDLKLSPVEWPKLSAFLNEMEFRTLTSRIENKLRSRGTDMSGGAPGVTARPESMYSAPVASAHKATTPIAPVIAFAGEGGPEQPAVSRDRYEMVQDLGALQRWIARGFEAGVIAFDTETTNLSPTMAEIVGFSLAVAPGEACYVPLGHRKAGGGLDFGGDGELKQIPLQQALDALKPLLADPGVLKVGQNIKYDMAVLNKYGVSVAAYDDTMLMSYTLDAGKHGHGMDELSQRHLSHTPISYDEVTGTGKARLPFAEVALDKARDYAAEDADVTLRLWHVLKPRLLAEKQVTLYETIERPLPDVVCAMECAGIKVDPAELNRLSADFAQRMETFEKKAHELAEDSFNIGSPKQLGEILFDKMKLPGGKKGKTGAYSTGAEVLEELAAEGHELPRVVLDWRQLQKLKSTYSDALVASINPRTGRVHTSFALSATNTGRFASSDPNLQNIPVRTEEGRKIRKAFVADKGHKIISADYSQIELRILAHIADIGTLKDAFRDGIDIHALTASQVFNTPVEGMDPMVRRAAKAINFGIIYGMSAFGLAAQLGIPQREAQSYIEAYFQRYPGIRAYMDSTKKQVKEQGFVTTLYGRRVHFPNINSKNPAERAFLERAAINAPIQGSAADIIKRAMAKLPAAIAAQNLSARMLLQVHDELVFEAKETEVDALIAVAKDVMQAAAQLDVPLVVEAGVGDNWEAAH
ncbi:DNA polymerase I [Ferrovibrio terrae]|uniref:DNA polymerase I n=1 Tax=Ferrovibrio terrae TaxID=2594003 RepID=A0A516GWY3_9PROT|nr:DNA polymerase I [Ferrovibrio terrae]QDO96046.1 DNA polymerase I [Ferrovibrio terrae]